MCEIGGDVLEFFSGEQTSISNESRSYLLGALLVVSYPLMIAKSLYALRHVSYVGISSVMLLLFVIISKSYHTNVENREAYFAARPGNHGLKKHRKI